MSGGTGRLPGWMMPGIPTCIYVSIVFIAYCLYGGGTFFFFSQQPGSRLERDDFCHINASSHLARDNIVLTLRYLQ